MVLFLGYLQHRGHRLVAATGGPQPIVDKGHYSLPGNIPALVAIVNRGPEVLSSFRQFLEPACGLILSGTVD